MPSRPRPRSTALSTLSAALLVLGLAASGCALRGSGVETTEAREVDPFTKVDIGGAFNLLVHVDPGAAQKVEVRGDDNIVDTVTTKVEDGELRVGIEARMIRPQLPLTVEIWAPTLVGVDASGASDITVEGLHGERFDLEVSGASDSRLSGAVDSFEVEISGAGEVEARTLQAKHVELELSGAGEVEVFASESLEVEISGAGEVRYWGGPTKISKDVSGAGTLEPGA